MTNEPPVPRVPFRSIAALTPVRRNILANLAGNGANAAATLICTPIYVHLLGIESYGLIGVYMTLQTLSIFLDMGLSTTITRETARLSADPCRAGEMRDLVRTLEILYWSFAAAICVTVVLLAPAIANNWLHFDKIKPSEGEQAIRMAGVAIGLRWPLTLYSGGLMGLQRQVLQNWILSTSAILQSVGAVLILWAIAPTTAAFFAWQVVAAVIPVVWARQSLWQCLPVADSLSRYSMASLRSVGRFTAGAGVFTATSMMLNQVDKVILSKMVPLESFGYYNLASVAAGSIYRLVGPVFSALFPRFSALVSLNDTKRLTQTYHKGCELVSVLILPATVVGAVFSGPILLVWTRNVTTSLSTHAMMSLLLVGSALNALIYLPYALQLAYGWTTLGVYMNLFGLIAAAALLPLLISHHGAIGAAAAKLIVSCAVFALGPCIMHRRVLVGEMWRWFVDDVCKPLAAASLCVAVAACFRIEAWTPGSTLAFLLGTFVLASAAASLAAKDGRAAVAFFLEYRLGWVRKAEATRPVRPL